MAEQIEKLTTRIEALYTKIVATVKPMRRLVS
jgi:hypothetical protein